MYASKTDKISDEYTTVVIRKGGKIEFDIFASEVGSILRWTFLIYLRWIFSSNKTLSRIIRIIQTAGNFEARITISNSESWKKIQQMVRKRKLYPSEESLPINRRKSGYWIAKFLQPVSVDTVWAIRKITIISPVVPF